MVFAIPLLLGMLATTCLTQQKSVTFLRLGRDILKQKLDLGSAGKQDRISVLRKLFTDGGCGVREQPVSGTVPNLLCSSHGTSDSVIVLLASSDYSAKGDEAAVRWGDLVMLPVLAESIGSVLTRHTFVYLAVSGASKGQAGASSYLEHLTPDQRKKIHAVVALDHIGRNSPSYSVPGSPSGFDLRNGAPQWDPSQLPITRSIAAAATRWNFPVPRKDDADGSNDTKPFRSEDIPAITFSSPRWIVTGYIGETPVRDFRDALDLNAYSNTYLFLSTYLLLLDQDLGKDLPTPTPESVAPNPTN